MTGDDRRVRGRLVFGPDVSPFVDATLYVRIEDVGRADAPSRIVAEQVMHHVTWAPGRSLEFNIQGALPAGSTYCQLRVHVDVDGDGAISPGDYVSTESHPVMQPGGDTSLEVRVHRV